MTSLANNTINTLRLRCIIHNRSLLSSSHNSNSLRVVRTLPLNRSVHLFRSRDTTDVVGGVQNGRIRNSSRPVSHGVCAPARRDFTSEAMPEKKEIGALCEEVKRTLPERFREDAWYLVVASTLVACGKPEELGPLYTYITETSSPTGQTLDYEAEKRVKARLSDLLMKEWTLVGIPSVVIAITALAKAEKGVKEEDVKVPEKRKNIDLNTSIPARGTKFLQAVYRENLSPIFASWGSYGPDFEWMEKAVIYGLFLSDHEVLSAVETEIVCVSAIMCQGWSAPTIWHLRGLRRMGVSEDDVELVQQGIEIVARWCGRAVEGWPRVRDVPDVIED